MNKTRRSLWCAWGSLILVIMVAPLLLFPGGWRSIALLVLPLIWIGNRIFTGHFIPRTPYDGVVLCLLATVLISLYATYDIAVSLPKIAGILLGVSVFYAVVNAADTVDRLRGMLTAIFVLIAAFSGLVFVGTDWGRKVPLLDQIGAMLPMLVRGLPGAVNGFHPAEVGGTLTWIVFLPVAAFMGLWSQRRTGSAAAALIGLGGLSVALLAILLLTQSRSAWLGFLAGAALMLWLVGRLRQVILIGAVAAGIAAVVLLGPDLVRPGGPAHATNGQLGTAIGPALSDRVEIWSRAIYGMQDFPLTGMGLGTFRYMVPVLYPLFAASPDVDLGHAHNEWLQAGVDLGLIGLIAFAGLQGLSFVLAYQAFRQPLPVAVHWLMAGVLAGLVAHSIYGLTDAVALGAKPGVFFWLLLALTAVVWRLIATAEYSPSMQPQVAV